MKQFEYLVCYVDSDGDYHNRGTEKYEHITKLGLDGWELVAVVAMEMGTNEATAYFKREINEPD